ncbi:MAG TPA: pyridoxal phosphate-dependent aminotransferase [Acidimicrobiia bacterium]|nr:pyridoxal phosphate-dependent aminotransferase [Acidimicrobiia bacterium]
MISQRVSQIAESATLAVDAKAKALKAAGENVIVFGAGEPDFPTPPHIVEAAIEAARDPKNHKYSPAGGLPALREAIAAKTLRDSGVNVDASQVVVSNGGKHALFNAFMCILNDGDEVILPAPYWTSYPEFIKIAGGVVREVFASYESGFCVTVEQLEEAFNDKTKAVVLVSPNNPTGTLYSPEQIKAIGEWALSKGIYVLTDEIYEHLVFDGLKTTSILKEVPELGDKCIILNGVAKTYAMTGWRVGWMIASKEIAKAATNLQSHSTSNVNNMAQYAAIAALSGDLESVHEMREVFQRRGVAMYEMLTQIDRVFCIKPQGAFYCFPSFEGYIGATISGKKIESTLQLCEIFLDEIKVAAVPGEAFGAPGYIRFSFALSDEDAKEGIARIAQLCETATWS